MPDADTPVTSIASPVEVSRSTSPTRKKLADATGIAVAAEVAAAERMV
jgi:hypothetical protein